MQDSQVLQLSSVKKSFGDVTAVDDANLAMARGGITALLGPSGCGKSTILRLIAGLERADRGRIVVDGALMSDDGYNVAPERRPIGLVFQDYALFPHLSVVDNVAFGLVAGSRGARRERALTLLDDFGLIAHADSWPHMLSGGEQQRVALARAWARDPLLLFLDEPTASLDPAASRAVEAIIRAIHATGTTIVLATHDLGQARRLAEQVVLLHRGSVLEAGPARRFFDHPSTPEAAAFVQGDLLP